MKRIAAMIALVIATATMTPASAYPPAVGILGKSGSCLACHVNNGPWSDETKTIVDILDKETGQSLKQADGTFLIEAARFRRKTVTTVIGRVKGDTAPPPRRNAWLYVDPSQIGGASLSKFAPGWSIDLPMACRLAGDKTSAYDGAGVTALPMTVRPLDDARDATLELHVMLTSGESVKGDAKAGMLSNSLVRGVRLKIRETE